MPRRLISGLFILLISLLVTAGGLEIVIRLAAKQDADGNTRLRSIRLLPERLQVNGVRAVVDDYLGSSDSYLIYDSFLGWTIRPNSVTSDQLYRSNSDGIR